MVAGGKIQESSKVFLSFFSRKLRITIKNDRSSGLLHFTRPSHSFEADSGFWKGKTYRQFTAAGTATDFNSIPLINFAL